MTYNTSKNLHEDAPTDRLEAIINICLGIIAQFNFQNLFQILRLNKKSELNINLNNKSKPNIYKKVKTN